ncbi:L-threonylcarbamoyladenylate synthase [Desulfovermiculus halophilus]|uniref:L-threonylcarbamoyladenylate synthase n=1 Tax=Desulfovermiculus halophilus TaxID=339722 RepID=UPI0004833A82|nr:L-threonylcarbamoyladenylate synthase [Desulfovermiculus halophilus]
MIRGHDGFGSEVHAVVQGEVFIYPTETLYALGCSALDPDAAEEVVRIKGRERHKPLPLIVGCVDQLDIAVCGLSPDVHALARGFWPGPLSIVLPGREALSPRVKDPLGHTSVRLTSHPLARELCMHLGAPLVSTSANPAGEDPASDPAHLHPGLIRSVHRVITGPPHPRGGLPSTVVRIVDRGTLCVLRCGAVTRKELQAAGWRVIETE